MRSFFLLIISYWSHFYVPHELNSNESVTIIMANTISGSEICECRFCLLGDTICDSIIRHSIPFKTDFFFRLCANNFCIKNMTESIQCHWIYSIKAEHLQHNRCHLLI
jgi:hypothetical protein